MKIRPATEADHDAIWNIFRRIVAAADTYALDPNMSRQNAFAYWFAPATHTYVAEVDAKFRREAIFSLAASTPSPITDASPVIVGTYILRPNQAGGGSHVASAACMVSPSTDGQ